jgi:translocation and assembly module TamA
MTLARRLRVAWAVAAVLGSAGCASLPSGSPAADAATATPAVATRAYYRLEVEPGGTLGKLLTEHLDLARFQNAPVSENIDSAEIDRLLRAAPAQARELLETEGYFNAEVTARHAGNDADGLPRLQVVAEPGPRATVTSVDIEVVGDLQTAAAAGDAHAARSLAGLRSDWPLHAGDAFRQSAWAAAKSDTLAKLRARGYAGASWRSTTAHVDAADNRVAVAVVVDSGPRYRLGEIRVDGLSRYDADSVRRLANFAPGDPYTEQLLLDFQDRLQKIGLFEGAAVVLDADPATAQAAPVQVRVKEQTLQLATLGVGYSANTGARVSVEHTHRKLFGTRWAMKNKFELGPTQQLWEGDLSSHPLEHLYRNLISGSGSRLLVADQTELGWNARVGRTQDTPRLERRYFIEYTQSRVDSDALTSQADAGSLNYQWVFRAVDNVLLPTDGLTTSTQVALGYSRGIQSLQNEPQTEARGPFSRLYGRLTWYQKLGATWYGSARVEAGEVFTRDVIGVPDALLFRAGGDESVRGYAYRTLGPTVDGAITSGRNLLTGSLEIARPIAPQYPAYWWAAFVDAGNAANGWDDLKPVLGYGLGLRWRSPVGPLRLDLAYGHEVQQVRMTLSVGIVF